MESAAKAGHNNPPKTLNWYALEIRELLHYHDQVEADQRDRELVIGKLLKEVIKTYFPNYRQGGNQKLRKTHSEDFFNWCDANLKNRKGQPYTKHTIQNYLSRLRDPEAVKDREQEQNLARQKRNLIQSKKYEQIIARTPAIESLVSKKQFSVSDEVNFLMTAWEKACNAARKQFLEIAGLVEI